MPKPSVRKRVVANVGAVDLVVNDVRGEHRVGGVGGAPGEDSEDGHRRHHVGIGQALSQSPHENLSHSQATHNPQAASRFHQIVNDKCHIVDSSGDTVEYTQLVEEGEES